MTSPPLSDQTSVTGIHSAAGQPTGKRLALLVLGALGVVYGDIGTSPLYAIKACFASDSPHPVPLNHENVLGILSLILWSLTIVISIKYVAFVMRADNRGEGGVLSLMALALRRTEAGQLKARTAIVACGLFGAALLYGDGMITPAISVLSAVEGLKVVTNWFDDKIIYITIAILFGLFLVQSSGTHRIGRLFGPLVLTWFATLGLLGVRGIVMHPGVVEAFNPWFAARFLIDNTWTGFVALSAVFLAVTGGEALYADMGHFGRRPIRIGWYCVALPCLVLNYFGQGALLLISPEAKEQPFFLLVPDRLRIPCVILATMATAVASQAVISGAFSLTKQEIQLGYLPRLAIRHTSHEEIGQIYVPQVNWMLMIATIWLVLEFRTSSALEGAYGFAVATTMVITTFLLFFIARRSWGWRRRTTVLVLGSFLVVDFAFFASNLTKIQHGGYVPLIIGIVTYVLMTTWRAGRELIAKRFQDRAFPLHAFIADAKAHPPLRVPGNSVFMTSSPDVTPVALLHNVKNNRVLHQTVIVLAIKTEEIPHVRPHEQVSVDELGESFFRINARYGFMDTPDVQQLMDRARALGYDWPIGKTTFFLGKTTLLPTSRPGMALWRKKLFSLMTRNAERATAYFRIPPGRVVELGMQVEL